MDVTQKRPYDGTYNTLQGNFEKRVKRLEIVETEAVEIYSSGDN
jgi:hypothetical protein